MSDERPHLEPGPDHPITVEPSGKHVSVRLGGEVIAESDRALELREASYPAVFYIPIEDVRDGVLEPSDDHTYCPYKGEASYYDLAPAGPEAGSSAVWTYPTPYPAVAEIAGHVAFYPDRVEIAAS